MCYKTKCSTCGLNTWAGCGQHVKSALARVPLEERCPAWQTGAGSHALPPGEKWVPTEAQAQAAEKIKSNDGCTIS